MTTLDWTTSFNSIHTRLAAQLTEPERELIALCPAGTTASALAKLAFDEAVKGLQEQEVFTE